MGGVTVRHMCVSSSLSHIYPFLFKKNLNNPLFRCPLARRAASGSGTRPCRGPSANAAAVFPLCGGWTPPPRGRQRGTRPSIRQASLRRRLGAGGALLCSVAVAELPFNLISLLQVFVDGMEPAKKPQARTCEDSASEKAVSTQISLFSSCCSEHRPPFQRRPACSEAAGTWGVVP